MRFIATVLLLFTFAFAVAAQEPPSPAKEADANKWKEFTSKDGQFSVLLPGTPTEHVRTLQTEIGPVQTRDFMLDSGVAFFYLYYSEFRHLDRVTPLELKEMLASTQNRAVSNLGKLISEADVSVAGIPGRELLALREGMVMRARIFYAKNRLYILVIGVHANRAFSDRKPSANPADRTEVFEGISAQFFNSFKFTT